MFIHGQGALVLMKITLSPQRRDDALIAYRFADTLVLNGETFDFSQMGEGDTLPSGAIKSHWLIGPVHRVKGKLELTLLLPLPQNYSQAQAFPTPLLLTADGLLPLPTAND